MAQILTWNDLLNIELRNPKNQDVERLIAEVKEQRAQIRKMNEVITVLENKVEELELQAEKLEG